MIAWLGKIITSIFGLKVFMSGVLMTILAIVGYNLVVDVVEEVMNFALAQIQGTDFGDIQAQSLSGFAAWFLAQLKFAECIAVVAAATAVRFVLRKIPFLRW